MLEGLFTPAHLVIILALALLILGPKRLPEAGRGLGSGIRGFKDALTGPSVEDEASPAGAAAGTDD
jgi:sec-independent protein translocase protein TatA